MIIPSGVRSIAALVTLGLAPLLAQGKLTVQGVSTMSVPCDHIIVRANVFASAESADDANVKFDQARTRFGEAIEKLEIGKVSVSGDGASFAVGPVGGNNNRMHFGNQTQEEPDNEVTVSEVVSIRLDDLQGMDRRKRLSAIASIVQSIHESGVELLGTLRNRNVFSTSRAKGKKTPIEYGVSGTEEIEEENLKSAIEDAKKRAKRVADAAEVKLGRILSIDTVRSGSNWKTREVESTHTMTVSVTFEIPE